jgi:hypothetical protein
MIGNVVHPGLSNSQPLEASLDRLVEDSLVLTGSNGRLYIKADDLAPHRSGKLPSTRMSGTSSGSGGSWP